MLKLFAIGVMLISQMSDAGTVTQAPSFNLIVGLSEKAMARLIQLHESVSVVVSYDVNYNDGTDPQTMVTEAHAETFPGGGIVEIPAKDLSSYITGKAEFYGIEYYAVSARRSSAQNLLSCEVNMVTPNQLSQLQRLPLGIYCKLLDE